MCGHTVGDFAGAHVAPADSSDYIAVALDEDGVELWRWQVWDNAVTTRFSGRRK